MSYLKRLRWGEVEPRVQRVFESFHASRGNVPNLFRVLGRRPSVRGSAMTPRDHPHGGGEGKAPIGHAGPKTPWGKPALGYKTRNNKVTDQMIVKRRK